MPDQPSSRPEFFVSTNSGAVRVRATYEAQRVVITLDGAALKLQHVESLRHSGQRLTITLANTGLMLSPSSRSPKIAGPASVGLPVKKPRVSLGRRTVHRTTST